MSRDVELLEPDFKTTALAVLNKCKKQGHVLRPFFTVRHPAIQCKLWRQSRSTSEIKQACVILKQEGAEYLSELLESVGPQHGRWATSALPGQSWHQWGEAIDCFVVNGYGKAVWSSRHEGYKCYGETAKELGLNAGYFWQRQDAVHLQKRKDTVRSLYTWRQIDEEMQRRFPATTEE